MERLVPVVHRDPPVQVAMDPVSVQARFLKRQLSFPVSTMSQ